MQPLRTILYYDTNIEIVADTVFSLREKGGLDVFVYASYDESLPELSTLKPDMILVGAQILDLSAVELIHKLRTYDNLMQTPAVVYTRENLDKDIVARNDVGIIDVLKKPMRGSDLIIRLHELWGEAR